MHFCAGLPIILVGCKKDLRRDPRVIEELRKTSQRPVTPEEASSHNSSLLSFVYLVNATGYGCGQQDWGEALPRVFSTNGRGCPRGIPVCHPGCASQSAQEQRERRLRGLVDYLL